MITRERIQTNWLNQLCHISYACVCKQYTRMTTVASTRQSRAHRQHQQSKFNTISAYRDNLKSTKIHRWVRTG